MSSADRTRKTGMPPHSHTVLIAVVVLGMTAAVFLSRWIDAHRPAASTTIEEENLYVTGKAASHLSLTFKGLVADWYWMRSLQYVGDKILSVPENVQLDNLGQLNLKLLAPLLDVATTLDPQFLEPYEYAAVVLPAVDVKQAIRITKKGIDANPSAWVLYHQLGYIYWQQRDFEAASEAYGRGAKIPGAPPWMEAMKARMAAEGGSRTTAREIYRRMVQESADEKVRDMARRRLLQIDSFEQREVLQELLNAYQKKFGRCLGSWKDLGPVLRTIRFAMDDTGAPLDPAGTAYVLTSHCRVDLNPKSLVPYN
jgi:tetratricopeptide (TPR) repeat protein